MLRNLRMYVKIALITIFLPQDSRALPDGAPVCVVGTYAPDPFAHKFPLDEISGRYVITIGGAVLRSGETLKVPSGVDLPFNISKAASAARFKGVLAIVNNPTIPLLNSLLPTEESGVKVQENCPPLGYSGITHIVNDPKNSIEGTLRLNTDVEAFIDVNIVVVNVAHQTIYFYSRFQIASFGIPPAPLSPPVAPPSAAPVTPPTTPPSAAPVTPPLSPPVTPPVSPPVTPPVPVPVPVPITPPQAAPVATPPVTAPSTPSTTTPTTAPVTPPFDLPTPTTPPTCGLLGLNILCWNRCGLFRRLLNLC